MATPAKEHEKRTLKNMERAGLILVTPLGDGLIYTGNPRHPMVHSHDVPSDLIAGTKDGRIVLVECKRSENKSLNCERSEKDALIRKNGKKGFAGIKWHQADALILATAIGGVGIVVVEFESAGVWALDGAGLRVWIESGDMGNGDFRKSISLDHFREFGTALGTAGNWRFPVGMFDQRERATA
jgi:hypothetical protein